MSTIVRTMSRDPETSEQDEPLSRQRKQSEPVSGEKIRENLLLLSGIGLLLLASGMVLSNILS
ncbi:hypothetical protein [uncultured Roseibium sp.]|uniref:hypothetical protein n=1 Tax=uncultured Roseibium sp. TaxID=1936171 RepID=UPI002639DA44|nr:hypothetical protein [uncultured Roseibium sp.]